MRGYPILNYSEGRVWFARKLKPVIRTFPDFDLTTNRSSGLAWFFLKAKQPDGRFGFNTYRHDTVLDQNPGKTEWSIPLNASQIC